MPEVRKILIVDDNVENLDVLGLVFEDEGYFVKQLNTAKEIFDHINDFEPNLILMDVMLGDENGIDICNQIKLNLATAHIKVILMTASHAFLTLNKDKCFADHYIAKPFDIDDVVSVANSTA